MNCIAVVVKNLIISFLWVVLFSYLENKLWDESFGFKAFYYLLVVCWPLSLAAVTIVFFTINKNQNLYSRISDFITFWPVVIVVFIVVFFLKIFLPEGTKALSLLLGTYFLLALRFLIDNFWSSKSLLLKQEKRSAE